MDPFEALMIGSVEMRRQAARALGEIHDVAAIGALIQAFNDNDVDVQEAAADSLRKIGNAAAVAALIQALKEGYDEVRRRAAITLGKIGDAAATSALLQALNDRSVEVRIAAVGALGAISYAFSNKMGHSEAVFALIEALKNKDSRVRHAAAIELGVRVQIVAVPALLQALDDSSLDVREAVSRSLERYGDTVHLPRNVIASAHISVAGRIAILEAMGHVRPYPRIVGFLLGGTMPDRPSYPVLPVLHYCEELLKQDDVAEDVKAGAREIVAQQMLLRPGARNSATEPAELLRTVSTSEDTASPAESLRASEAPQETGPTQKCAKAASEPPGRNSS